jgi:hypothetical protein
MVFFRKRCVFLHVSWTGLFGNNEPFSTLTCRKYSFHKLIQFSQGTTCQMPQLLTYMVSLEWYKCFFNSVEYAYLEQTEPISTLKHLSCRKYSFQKRIQFSQGNNVFDAPACNKDGFFQEIHLFLQLSQRGLFGTKWALLHIENYDLQRVFLSKTNSILTGKQCFRCSCF